MPGAGAAPRGLRGLAGVWARPAAAGQALRASSFAGVSLVEVTALAPAMCAGSGGEAGRAREPRGWPGPRGERGSVGVGGVAQPGVRQLDSPDPGGGEGTWTPPGQKKLWQDRAGLPHHPVPLPLSSLPLGWGGLFLNPHFLELTPPRPPTPLAHQYPLPGTGTCIGNDLYFSLTSN